MPIVALFISLTGKLQEYCHSRITLGIDPWLFVLTVYY
ncbi:hypothetical protein PPEP_a1020 [Pseudoalteromonas peptidolytica F12-50-A1]|uniref:Uncharacterized protein n=1 Tax=Pseudoalteromonas peptidolytica F12-50-A1 TaxID=1315280 RepID=A0A8I0MUA1_9GAMM|nr:hypothetical protein [Pseudoalteromonas peptidolytica F12-50-A1]